MNAPAGNTAYVVPNSPTFQWSAYREFFLSCGNVALVTGATSGIGAATAALLAERGAHVLVAGRDASRGESVTAAIRAHGGKADFLAADLTTAEAARDLARRATDIGGAVDVLVNNAGIYPFGPTADTAEDQFDAVYALNVKAPYYLVAELAPPWRSAATAPSSTSAPWWPTSAWRAWPCTGRARPP